MSPLRVENARTKFDRRQMAFADRTKAHDEALRAARQAALIGCRHDRRVEESRAFRRVLVREIGANQSAAARADMEAGVRDVARDRLEMTLERAHQVAVTRVEVPRDLGV